MDIRFEPCGFCGRYRFTTSMRLIGNSWFCAKGRHAVCARVAQQHHDNKEKNK